MKRTLPLLACLFLGVFLGFTVVVQQHVFDLNDVMLTIKLQTHLNPLLITIFSFFSLVGAAEVISWCLLPFLRQYRWQSWPIFIGYGFGSLIEIVGKLLINHASPPPIFFRYDLGLKFPSAYLSTLDSYPSGHVFRTIFIITCWLIVLYQTSQSVIRKLLLTLLGVSFCVIMLVSRVALGEHWTTDVIGGLLLGLGLAFTSFAFLQSSKTKIIARKIQHAFKEIFSTS